MLSFRQVLSKIESYRVAKKTLQLVGSLQSFKTLFAATLLEKIESNHELNQVVFLCASVKECQKWFDFFVFLSSLSDKKKLAVHQLSMVSYWDISKHKEHVDSRFANLASLNFMAQEESKGVVVATLEGLLQKIFNQKSYSTFCQKISCGKKIDLDDLEQKILFLGYNKCSFAKKKGSYARRGGVLDVFSIDGQKPVRLEFIGDIVSSLRFFEPETQKTFSDATFVNIIPCWGDLLSSEKKKELTQQFYSLMVSKSLDEKHRTSLLESFKKNDYLFEFESISPSLKSELTNNLTLIGGKAQLVLLDSLSSILESFTRTQNGLELVYEALSEYPQLLTDPADHFWSESLFKDFIDKQSFLEFSQFQASVSYDQLSFNDFASLSLGSKFYAKEKKTDPEEALRESLKYYETGYTVIIFFPTISELNVVKEILLARSLPCVVRLNLQLELGRFLKGKFQKGFVLGLGGVYHAFLDDEFKLLFCDGGLFSRPLLKPKKISPLELLSHQNLSSGDLVVHEQHGIGQYVGLQEVSVSSGFFDFIKMTYRNNDILYVPIEKIGVLKKYQKNDKRGGAKTLLDKLGGSTWSVRKKKVQENIELLAQNLIQIEAQRKLEKGRGFSSPGQLYTDFCCDFPYEETPGQMRAIEEVESDLQSPVYMDRLLVGDVGFGKTEVAMRAAMYTVLEGFQVLFFVPTTVLCQQHYLRFLGRFNKYGVSVAALSRFQKKGSVEILNRFVAGKLDILIGTHVLLSKPLKSSRVGLIILDEEHKVGVKHKKMLRELVSQANILTMTATPIPRTLNMAVMGLRDVSMIQDPPQGRLSVKTFFSEKSELIIKNAINFELGRSGQIIYLHNTIENLPKIRENLERTFQGLRVVLVHGKLSPSVLGLNMQDFVEGRSQILLTTTIIESGIDIPNVNTLIVSDCEKYGLSQLHQLRGRIGRSETQSYAYFFYDKHSSLTESAKKRMEAMVSHESLGAGFHLASTDMVLRGVGNLLGTEQSGDVLSVGLDLYMEMLEEAVQGIKGGQPLTHQYQPEIKLKQKVGLLKSYIPEEGERVNIYKEIFSASSKEKVLELFNTLKDLYGVWPQEVENLYYVSLLKLVLFRLQAKSLVEVIVSCRFEAVLFVSEKWDITLMRKFNGYHLVVTQLNEYFIKVAFEVDDKLEDKLLLQVYTRLSELLEFLDEEYAV